MVSTANSKHNLFHVAEAAEIRHGDAFALIHGENLCRTALMQHFDLVTLFDLSLTFA